MFVNEGADGRREQVLKDHEAKAWLVQSLFSVIFMLSCSMYCLVLFEVLTLAPLLSWCTLRGRSLPRIGEVPGVMSVVTLIV